jgi:hypothetical protein
MLLLCSHNVSPKCVKVRSGHDRSARTTDSICPFCAEALRINPELKDRSLQSILEDKNARPSRRSTA